MEDLNHCYGQQGNKSYVSARQNICLSVPLTIVELYKYIATSVTQYLLQNAHCIFSVHFLIEALLEI